MKLTNRYFLTLMVAAAAVAASAGLGIADTRSSDRQVVVAAAPAESFVYFPAQYTLDASGQASGHIEAF